MVFPSWKSWVIYVIFFSLFFLCFLWWTHITVFSQEETMVLARKFLVWVEDPYCNPLWQRRAEMAPQTSSLCPKNLDGEGHADPETKGTRAQSCCAILSPARSKNEWKGARGMGPAAASAFPSVGSRCPSMGARLSLKETGYGPTLDKRSPGGHTPLCTLTGSG